MSALTRDLNEEFYKLAEVDQRAVRQFVEEYFTYGLEGHRNRELGDGRELYAYRHPRGVSWGINGVCGWNVARGVFMNGEIR